MHRSRKSNSSHPHHPRASGGGGGVLLNRSSDVPLTTTANSMLSSPTYTTPPMSSLALLSPPASRIKSAFLPPVHHHHSHQHQQAHHSHQQQHSPPFSTSVSYLSEDDERDRSSLSLSHHSSSVSSASSLSKRSFLGGTSPPSYRNVSSSHSSVGSSEEEDEEASSTMHHELEFESPLITPLQRESPLARRVRSASAAASAPTILASFTSPPLSTHLGSNSSSDVQMHRHSNQQHESETTLFHSPSLSPFELVSDDPRSSMMHVSHPSLSVTSMPVSPPAWQHRDQDMMLASPEPSLSLAWQQENVPPLSSIQFNTSNSNNQLMATSPYPRCFPNRLAQRDLSSSAASSSSTLTSMPLNSILFSSSSEDAIEEDRRKRRRMIGATRTPTDLRSSPIHHAAAAIASASRRPLTTVSSVFHPQRSAFTQTDAFPYSTMASVADSGIECETSVPSARSLNVSRLHHSSSNSQLSIDAAAGGSCSTMSSISQLQQASSSSTMLHSTSAPPPSSLVSPIAASPSPLSASASTTTLSPTIPPNYLRSQTDQRDTSSVSNIIKVLFNFPDEELGHRTFGHSCISKEEIQEALQNGNHDLLYGELLPIGATKMFDSSHLNLKSARTLCDLGSGLGKLTIQAFLQYPNLTRVFGCELSYSRYAKSCEAIQKLYQTRLEFRKECVKQQKKSGKQQQQQQQQQQSGTMWIGGVRIKSHRHREEEREEEEEEQDEEDRQHYMNEAVNEVSTEEQEEEEEEQKSMPLSRQHRPNHSLSSASSTAKNLPQVTIHTSRTADSKKISSVKLCETLPHTQNKHQLQLENRQHSIRAPPSANVDANWLNLQTFEAYLQEEHLKAQAQQHLHEDESGTMQLSSDDASDPQHLTHQSSHRTLFSNSSSSSSTETSHPRYSAFSISPQRSLDLHCCNLFNMTEAFEADVVICETKFNEENYPALCQFLLNFKRGSRLLTYENLDLCFHRVYGDNPVSSEQKEHVLDNTDLEIETEGTGAASSIEVLVEAVADSNRHYLRTKESRRENASSESGGNSNTRDSIITPVARRSRSLFAPISNSLADSTLAPIDSQHSSASMEASSSASSSSSAHPRMRESKRKREHSKKNSSSSSSQRESRSQSESSSLAAIESASSSHRPASPAAPLDAPTPPPTASNPLLAHYPPHHRNPFRQLPINVSKQDRFYTTWATNLGHHFFLWQRM